MKPNIVESFVDVKSNDVEVSVDLKQNIDYKENIIKHIVSKLVYDEVDTRKHVLTNLRYKVRGDLNNWARQQASMIRFILIIDKSYHGGGRRPHKLILGV